MKFVSMLMLAIALAIPAGARAGAWDVGPPVGSKAPPLHVTDLKGAPVALRDLSGKNGVVLVFFRSAKWCPYCQKQLIDLKDAPGPLAERGYKLAAISYDPTDVLTQFTDKREISYPLLSDVGSVTIDAWKLRDVRYKPDSFAWGVPYASIYVISPKGVLRAKLAEEDYKVRPPLSAILAAIDGLPKGR
jgi:peroxiredoxin